MRFNVLTLFPEIFEMPLSRGVVGQAVTSGKVGLKFHNPREFSTDIHKTIDDRPFGGGDGMIMMAEPLRLSLEQAKQGASENRRVIYLSPQGKTLNHSRVLELTKYEQIILICGRYGGVDQRFLSNEVDEELSIGDYVLSGGELAAMVVIDAVARHLPGVLGNSQSALQESFSNGLLEAPQFTRPRSYEGLEVPEILLSGNHERIARWKYLVSLLRTKKSRADLLKGLPISKTDWSEAAALEASMSPREQYICGLCSKAEHGHK
jgi:tRNA (guanine37-N1)-methyltransferase